MKKNNIIDKDIQKQMSEEIKKVMGYRSARRTSEESGVSFSYISGIKNGKFIPSPEIIRKLTDPASNPQNGVTYEDFMVSAGYKDYIVNIKNDLYSEPISLEKSSISSLNNRLHSYAQKISKKNNRPLQIIITGLIYSVLTQKGYIFTPNSENEISSEFSADMVINLTNQIIEEWSFNIISFDKEDKSMGVDEMRCILFNLMFMPADDKKKISFVTDSKEVYTSLTSYKEKISFKGNVSVILVDSKELTIEKEEYISHFDAKSKELLIG